MANSPLLVVRMSEHLKARIEAQAQAKGLKASELLKMLAVEYLDRQGPVQEYRGKELANVS
jgi:hypothetical protein